MLLLIIVGAILEPDVFPTSDNILNVLRQSSVIGVLAIGMTFVIATAGIDLSVGSMVAAAAAVGGQLASSGSMAFLLGALATGILLGGINAGLIAYGKVVPFIATLAMFAMARGLALWISDKTPVSIFDLEGVRWFGTGEVIGIPAAVIVFAAVAIGGWVLLNRTSYGRHVVAVGGNREAARIAGVKVSRIIFSVYVISGICVAIAAILVSGRLSSASPVIGNLYELDAIAAVVIGGTALSGGRATIVGTVLGVLTFALIFNLHDADGPRGRDPAGHQGGDHRRRRPAPTQAALTSSTSQHTFTTFRRRGGVPMSIKRLVIPLCAALALGLAACGSDDDGGGDGGSTVKQDGEPRRRASRSRSPSAHLAPTTAGWPRSRITRASRRRARGRHAQARGGRDRHRRPGGSDRDPDRGQARRARRAAERR